MRNFLFSWPWSLNFLTTKRGRGGGGGLLFLLKVICFKVIKVIFQILALFKVLFFSDSTMIYHNFSPPFGE